MAKKRESILVDDLKHCIVCGRPHPHIHEVFFGKNRQRSIRDKMVLPLCYEHHEGDSGPHKDHNTDLFYKKMAQEKWEATYGTRKDFIAEYGKSYL